MTILNAEQKSENQWILLEFIKINTRVSLESSHFKCTRFGVTPGKCIASPGFVYDQDKNECVDVNECEAADNPCGEGTCINNNGNYECECPPDYQNIVGPNEKE